MLIINADDFGRDNKATETATKCFQQQRVSSVTAMVFMSDSQRAAAIAHDEGMSVGLHVNFTEAFSAPECPTAVVSQQEKIRKFLRSHKYALLFYNPLLRVAFRDVVEAQLEEFHRIFGKEPSHFDGHQHMHLCTNMLVGNFLPNGVIVRRSFSFNRGEKSAVNRAYRSLVDWRLSRRYKTTDFFFSLGSALNADGTADIVGVSSRSKVELMTHTWQQLEYDWLMSDGFLRVTEGVDLRSYEAL